MNTNTVTEDERTKPATKSKVKPIPDGMHAVTPHLICAGAADARRFCTKRRSMPWKLHGLPGPGRQAHAWLPCAFGDSVVMLVDELPEWGSLGPEITRGLAGHHPPLRGGCGRGRRNRRCERAARKSRCRSRTLFGVIATARRRPSGNPRACRRCAAPGDRELPPQSRLRRTLGQQRGLPWATRCQQRFPNSSRSSRPESYEALARLFVGKRCHARRAANPNRSSAAR